MLICAAFTAGFSQRPAEAAHSMTKRRTTDDDLEHWKQHYMHLLLGGDMSLFVERVGWWNVSGDGRSVGKFLLFDCG